MEQLTNIEIQAVSGGLQKPPSEGGGGGGGFWSGLWDGIESFFGGGSGSMNAPLNPCPPGQNFDFTQSGETYHVTASAVGPEGVINFDLQKNGSNYKEHITCTQAGGNPKR